MVLYVSFYEAYPPSSGAAAVTWNCAKRSGGATTLIQLGRTPSDRIVEGVRVITLVGSGRGFRKLVKILDIVHEIVHYSLEAKPEYIVLEGASWVVYHWLLVRAIKRSKLRCQIWYHSHNVEKILRRNRSGLLIAWITGLAEKRVLRISDRKFAVSPVDSRKFREFYDVTTELWPNGVDFDRFARVSQVEIDITRKKYGLGERTILFMGLYAYPPNKRAVDFLLGEVIPLLLKRNLDFQLLVIGGSLPFKESWLINPGVVKYEELPSVVGACRLGVAPVFEGSGTRLKILEYGAAGLPVVSTAKGAEGLTVSDGESIYLRENGVGFAEAITTIVTNNSQCAVGKSLQEIVGQYYSYETIMNRIWDISP